MIVGLVILLSLFGLLMIYESSNVSAFRDFGDKYHYVKDQLVWMILGLCAFTFFSFFDYHKLYNISPVILFGTIILLVLVFVPGIGIKALGAHRWIRLGSFNFQPAEVSKLAIIIYLSSWFTYKEKGRLLPFVSLLLIILGLVIAEPDLGTSIIIMFVSLVLYFLSGAPFWQFFLLIPMGALGSLFLSVVSPYRFKRLTTFLDPSIDPLGASYHIRQILIGLGSGGLFGLGLGSSRQKYEYLPEATTDSIFAIIGEELGFIGAIFLFSVMTFLIYRCFRIAKNAPDRFGQLLSGGIASFLSIQIVINLGSMVALFPLTGVPLPFISYGGSNLIVTMSGLGILLNASKQIVERKK